MSKRFTITEETPIHARRAMRRTVVRHERRATRCALRAALRSDAEG